MEVQKDISDIEMIRLVRESGEHLDSLYRRHIDYTMNFMKHLNYNPELNRDIYHDALIVLYEKLVNNPDFNMTSSIQTYLNSICRNQILVRFKKNAKHTDYSEQYDNRVDDWLENTDDEKSERKTALEKSMIKLKDLGGKCYEIIRRYFYENSSMEKIAFELEYTNADNVKNQKSRCQKKLKEFIFHEMNKK